MAAKKKEWTLEEFRELAKDQQIVYVAEANIAAYGSITPPKEMMLLALKKKCPNCGEIKPILSQQGAQFGIKSDKNGTNLRTQAWCSECRGSKDAHPGRTGLDSLPRDVRAKLSPEDVKAITKAIEEETAAATKAKRGNK